MFCVGCLLCYCDVVVRGVGRLCFGLVLVFVLVCLLSVRLGLVGIVVLVGCDWLWF